MVSTECVRFGVRLSGPLFWSICEQFVESLSGFVFTRSILGRTHILAPDKLEVFAVIGEVLFRDGVCAPIPALLGHTRRVTDAIQADL